MSLCDKAPTHDWRFGPVIEWEHVRDFNVDVHTTRDAYRVALAVMALCTGCGEVRTIRRHGSEWDSTL